MFVIRERLYAHPVLLETYDFELSTVKGVVSGDKYLQYIIWK